MPLAGTEQILAEAIKVVLIDEGMTSGDAADDLCLSLATVLLAHIIANATVSGANIT